MYDRDLWKEIKRVHYPPQFKQTRHYYDFPDPYTPYDIALVELESKLVWLNPMPSKGGNLQPACLPRLKDIFSQKDKPYDGSLKVSFGC